MSLQELYQNIAKKIITINDQYKDSKKELAEANTIQVHEHHFVNYYQKLDSEIMDELVILHKLNSQASKDLLNNLVHSEYKEALLEDLDSTVKAEKNVKIANKINDDIVKSRAKWLKEYHDKTRKDNSKPEEYKSHYYYRPFINENKSKFVVLLKEDQHAAVKTLIELQDYKLQKALCSKKYNQPAYDLLCALLLNLQRDLSLLKSFCEKNFYYDDVKRDTRDKKMHIKVIIDAIDKLGLREIIGRWLK